MISDAELSPCRKYRYSLRRLWDIKRAGVAFVMLNPSTADETTDDPTIRRIVDFAKRWGFGSAYVFNLYAYRATDPMALKPLSYEQRFGPGNTWALHRALNDFPVTVAAWGSNRMDPVPLTLKSHDRPLMCLGMTKAGEPKHPLYLPKDTQLIRYTADRYYMPCGCDACSARAIPSAGTDRASGSPQ